MFWQSLKWLTFLGQFLSESATLLNFGINLGQYVAIPRNDETPVALGLLL